MKINKQNNTAIIKPAVKLFAAMLIFWILFSYFALMRYYNGERGDPDYSTFEQSIYTTINHGKLQYNTFEERSHFRFRNSHLPRNEVLSELKYIDGNTHLAVHTSYIFFLTIPFYLLYQDLAALIILQVFVVMLGAWAVFLISKEYIDEKAGLRFGLLYLLNFPIHGILFDSFHELGFLITPILFSYYFLIKKRYLPFWIMILLALSCKEDVSFLVAAYGLYVVYMGIKEAKMQGGGLGKWIKNPFVVNGVLMFAAGCLWLYLSLFVIIPSYRGGGYHFFGERYEVLGDSFQEAVITLITKPWTALRSMMTLPKLGYFLEIFAPLAFMSFFSFPAFLVSLPNFSINTLSNFSAMYNTGSRYAAPVLPFVFISAILGFSNILKKAKDEEDYDKIRSRWMKAAFFISISGALFFNPSPFRIGWKVPKITPHRITGWRIIDTIPKDASLSTQIDLFLYTCRRLHGYSGYKEGVRFILVDLGQGGRLIHHREEDRFYVEYVDDKGEVTEKHDIEKYSQEPAVKGFLEPIDKNPDLETIKELRKVIEDNKSRRIDLFKNKWFVEGSDWDLILPDLIRSQQYEIIHQEDGYILLEKV